jgi:SAM-dependent methyltransferase
VLGRKYAEDFRQFILAQVGPSPQPGMKVLEIGCGYGFLLYLLERDGFDVLGIEPRPYGLEGSRKYSVDIIQDTFPGRNNKLKRKGYDIIVHYAVLEHVEDPTEFLREQAEYLSATGLILFSVPDCSEYIMLGDISILLHEHKSYFTPYSLKKVAEQAGLQIVHLEKAGYGGALYGVGALSGRAIHLPEKFDHTSQFENKVMNFLSRTETYFQEALNENRTVGIFCPVRAINVLCKIKPLNMLRFFDDDEYLHGKYYPPFDIPIESRASLLAKPVDDLLIMSRSFGRSLRAELSQKDELKSTRITLVEELLSS